MGHFPAVTFERAELFNGTATVRHSAVKIWPRLGFFESSKRGVLASISQWVFGTASAVLVGAALSVAMQGSPALAQSRSNAETFEDGEGRVPQVTVCSQNLQMYGRFQDVRARLGGISAQEFRDKEIALVRRIVAARCDIIAVQEVVATTDERSQEVVDLFTTALRRGTGREWRGKVGSTNDEGMRNAIIVARDRASIETFVSYHSVALPKLSPDQKPRFFGRGPVEAQLAVRGRGDSARRMITMVNFHFKSKAGGQGDPTSLQWETYRMEMAEGLRRVVEERHRDSFASGENILVVLGDRNADFDSATAKILDGSLTIDDFQTGAACRLGKRGTPLCRAGVSEPPSLYSVLTLDPQVKLLGGTFYMGKRGQWLDDILLPGAALGHAWESGVEDGDFDSGIVSEPQEASDHALVYVRLYW